MIEIGQLTSRDVGRWVAWADEAGAHRGELITWEPGRLVVLVHDATDKRRRPWREYADPAQAEWESR